MWYSVYWLRLSSSFPQRNIVVGRAHARTHSYSVQLRTNISINVWHASCLDIFICSATDWFTNAIKLYYMFGINFILLFVCFRPIFLISLRMLLNWTAQNRKVRERGEWNGDWKEKRVIFTMFQHFWNWRKQKIRVSAIWYLKCHYFDFDFTLFLSNHFLSIF